MLRKLLIPETNTEETGLFSALASQVPCCNRSLPIARTRITDAEAAKITGIGILNDDGVEVKYAVENYTTEEELYNNVLAATRLAGYKGYQEEYKMGRASNGIYVTFVGGETVIELFGELSVVNFYSGAPMTTVVASTTHSGTVVVRKVVWDHAFGGDVVFSNKAAATSTVLAAANVDAATFDFETVAVAIEDDLDITILGLKINEIGGNTTIVAEFIGEFGDLLYEGTAGTYVTTYAMYATVGIVEV